MSPMPKSNAQQLGSRSFFSKKAPFSPKQPPVSRLTIKSVQKHQVVVVKVDDQKSDMACLVSSDKQDIMDAPRLPVTAAKMPLPLPPSKVDAFPDSTYNDAAYRHVRTLRSGAEGTCSLVEHRKSRRLFAMKTVRCPELVKGVPREAYLLQEARRNRSSHPNIIQLECWAYSDALTTPWAEYYMPFFPLGDLWDFALRFLERDTYIPEPFIWKVFLQLTAAIAYLHQGYYTSSESDDSDCSSFAASDKSFRGIVHRDIKPENILLRASPRTPNLAPDMEPYPDVVLADLGHAELDQFDYHEHGTVMWAPPEWPRSSPKGDVWSAGATIHFLVHGDPPIAPMPSTYSQTDSSSDTWERNPKSKRRIEGCPDEYTPFLDQALELSLRMEDRRPVATLLYESLKEWAGDAMKAHALVKKWGLPRWTVRAD